MQIRCVAAIKRETVDALTPSDVKRKRDYSISAQTTPPRPGKNSNSSAPSRDENELAISRDARASSSVNSGLMVAWNRDISLCTRLGSLQGPPVQMISLEKVHETRCSRKRRRETGRDDRLSVAVRTAVASRSRPVVFAFTVWFAHFDGESV